MNLSKFNLTKSEQRMVIVILLALLAGAFIKHYRDTHSNSFDGKQLPANSSPTAAPVSTPDPEDALSRENNSNQTPDK